MIVSSAFIVVVYCLAVNERLIRRGDRSVTTWGFGQVITASPAYLLYHKSDYFWRFLRSSQSSHLFSRYCKASHPPLPRKRAHSSRGLRSLGLRYCPDCNLTLELYHTIDRLSGAYDILLSNLPASICAVRRAI